MKRATTLAELGFAGRPRPAPAALPPPAAVKPAAPPVPMGDTVRVTRGTDVTGYQLSVVR
jgi:hypothetical protein